MDNKMEPMAGIEPATDGLRNRCSTTELHWRPMSCVTALAPCYQAGRKHQRPTDNPTSPPLVKSNIPFPIFPVNHTVACPPHPPVEGLQKWSSSYFIVAT